MARIASVSKIWNKTIYWGNVENASLLSAKNNAKEMLISLDGFPNETSRIIAYELLYKEESDKRPKHQLECKQWDTSQDINYIVIKNESTALATISEQYGPPYHQLYLEKRYQRCEQKLLWFEIDQWQLLTSLYNRNFLQDIQPTYAKEIILALGWNRSLQRAINDWIVTKKMRQEIKWVHNKKTKLIRKIYNYEQDKKYDPRYIQVKYWRAQSLSPQECLLQLLYTQRDIQKTRIAMNYCLDAIHRSKSWDNPLESFDTDYNNFVTYTKSNQYRTKIA